MTKHAPLRALVIDDSALSRQTITRMLESSPLIEVVGWASDGDEALRRTLELEPDLITLDLEMPRMDGFTFLRLVMARCPTPVIVVSGRDGETDVFKALELGAVDFVAKPNGVTDEALLQTQEALIRKAHGLRDLRVEKLRGPCAALAPIVPKPTRGHPESVPTVVIGASTGGPTALLQVLSAFLEVPSCAVLVAQHMPSGFTQGFAQRLGRMTAFDVREARNGDELEPGVVLIAPGGSHLEISKPGGRAKVRVVSDAGVDRNVPSIDRLFQSAAKELAENVIAIVLTGMGDDGREGAREIRAAGGKVIAESEETAVIYGMPKRVVNAGLADQVLPLHEIPAAILRITE